jgi:succinyl-CoA synthetase alpha subunit
LRNHLFETLEALKDRENPMDVDLAHAISSVAGKIIESAKIETDRIRALDAAGVLIKQAPNDFLQLEGPAK